MPMTCLTQLQGSFRKAEKIEVASAEDLSQTGLRHASQPDTCRPGNRDNQFRNRLSHEEGDIRVCALDAGRRSRLRCSYRRECAPSADSAIVAEATPMSRPQRPSDRLETVEAFIIDLRRLSFEILGRLEVEQ